MNWSGSTDINWEEILLAQLFGYIDCNGLGTFCKHRPFSRTTWIHKKQDKTMETVSSWKRNIHTASKTFLLVPFKQ